jgi:hypothetical protein
LAAIRRVRAGTRRGGAAISKGRTVIDKDKDKDKAVTRKSGAATGATTGSPGPAGRRRMNRKSIHGGVKCRRR